MQHEKSNNDKHVKIELTVINGAYDIIVPWGVKYHKALNKISNKWSVKKKIRKFLKKY